jgi:hypothetical protein
MLEVVKAALKQRGRWDAVLEVRFEEFERLCIEPIHSAKLREALLDYLENTAPLEFFTAPASSSGKNHPAWQSTVGGILLNTVECCIGIDRKLRMYPSLTDVNFNPRNEDRDIIYLATILSDTFKPDDAHKNWRDFSHHRTATEKWRVTAAQHHLPQAQTDAIADALFWHLGRFTPEWPEGADPHSRLSLLTFITHELDMDFSNRNLALVFDRKGVQIAVPSPDPPDTFLKQEFDTSSSYFAHIESKLLNIVTFYLTVILAVVAGIYYIAGSDMFAKMRFWHVKAPRAFFMGLVAIVFCLIGTFLLGMYTELRTRKILVLEEMARIREHFINAAQRAGTNIADAIGLVSGIAKCPPYLRRPSEDWYTTLLMVFVNAVSIAFGASAELYAFATNLFKGTLSGQISLFFIGALLFLVVLHRQFRWVTVFCYLLDCRREKKHGPSLYELVPAHESAYPPGLRWLNDFAARIEQSEKPKILRTLGLTDTRS